MAPSDFLHGPPGGRIWGVNSPCLAALCLLAGASSAHRAPGVDDTALLDAWRELPEPRRLDCALQLEAELGWLDTFQVGLVARGLALEPSDPGLLPEDEPPPYFDPEEHAPKDAIRRRWLEPDAKRVERARERFLGRHERPLHRSAWRYDWGSRRVLRTAPLEDPERTLVNALAGVPPHLDLAEALVLRVLDDGSEQEALAAFGHAYTDREGNAYPGLTLYDAWTSGEKMEMPDVDNLGIVHTLIGKKKRWQAPVRASQQDDLYEAVGELLTPARDHRALRTALARTYLLGRPALRDGYEFLPDRLHAMWAEVDSDLEEMLDSLPDSDEVERFLGKVARRIERSEKRVAAGRARREQLERDAYAVREVALRVLGEHGVGTD